MAIADIHERGGRGLLPWIKSGEPMIWLNAAAVSLSVVAVLGLLFLLAVRGFSHFWPRDVMLVNATYQGQERVLLGEVVEQVQVSGEQLREAGFELAGAGPFYGRSLIKQGNRDFFPSDFVWVLDEQLGERRYPAHVMVVERLEWGNFYGTLISVSRDGELLADASGEPAALWRAFQDLIDETLAVREQIGDIERGEIGANNYQMERLRLRERSLELEGALDTAAQAELAAERAALDVRYAALQEALYALYDSVDGFTYGARLADGREVELPVSKVVRAFRPNAMDTADKAWMYLKKLWEFLSAEPREANTEGGVFPAMFGTVLMVILMSIMVTPFGVVAAVYLREYARQGFVTRTIRVAVNNLAGVPSIVYGVFGLGFFVYFVGGEIDQLLFREALPSPTFGTPGLMWASLTLALLTLPVVIVATEEGLARIPKSIREGSLALGATRAETLWRVVLPMASPAMMTGLILAVARAAGEVAPLMLVGVVKLAPTLPLDGNYPYLHLDQKFMHLGFHIYDVGFQSPNVEAARPLVYATALLLVILIALLNFTAVHLRNRLRERYKSLEN
ncbi:phosphate ABC transporter permease PstA [Parahaliea mediterranea]|uniref:Phosphate transport system permease protein PstA n=1 Tax=Parahaliea mediterranea TaxID=651086 RepID=A0A939INW2_9GAMM|nr:phosphate ABC transporter permease PstA [Parahaliea mediterranea]MBN7798960.1 phosphate ABC transporter permease PstA [Parahaliea mediterranea]